MSPTLAKLLKRTLLLAAVSFAITQMLPSLADQLSPNPSIETASPAATPNHSAAPIESPPASASEKASAQPDADITYLESDTTTAKPKVIESDSLFFRTPNSLKVDPRANSISTQAFALGGAENILVCITSAKANISIGLVSNTLVDGQGTHSVTLSGSASEVLASLTASRGITALSSGRIAGSTLTYQVAALSEPSIDPKLCGGAKITRSVAVAALGIDLNTVKTTVKIR